MPPLEKVGRKQVLTDLRFVNLAGIYAEYEMLYTQNGMALSGLVNFSLDIDGIWRVSFF